MPARERTLVIHPDSFRLELALLEDSRHAGFVDASARRSFGQLVEACDGALWAGLALADPWLVRALLAVEAPALAKRGFGNLVHTPDFVVHAFRLRGELFAQDVSPGHLAEVAQRLGGRTADKAGALAALFEAVDERLARLERIDPRGLVSLATRRLRSAGLPPALERFETIEVRDLHDLPPVRLAFLDALARACSERGVSFRLVLPWAGSPQTDAFVGAAARFFERRWEAMSSAELVPEPSSHARAVGLRRLFEAEPSPVPVEGLEFISCATPRDEARAIALRVKGLLEAGVPPERIAVAFRDLADDTELVIEQLALLSIPARARLGVPLARTPIGRLALSLLGLADDGFRVEDVASLLESRYAPAVSKEMPPCRAAFAEAGIRNDVIGATAKEGAWTARLGRLIERKRRSALERPVVAAELEELERLQGGVQGVLALGHGIPPHGTALSMLEAFTRAVSLLGIEEALRESEPALHGAVIDHEVDVALARDQASFHTLTALLVSLRAAFTESGFGAVHLERRTFARWMALAAGELNLPASGPRAGAVWLVDARELTGTSFDALILGGLVDGRFPGRPSPLPLLSDDERAELNAASPAPLFRLSVFDDGVTLPMRLAEDRLLFHQALVAAPRVVLTASRLDARGREALPSPFLDALSRVAQPFPSIRRGYRPVPMLDEVACEADLAARASLELFSPLETRQSPRDARASVLEPLLRGAPWLETARFASAIETERLRFFSDPTRTSGQWSGRVDGEVLERLSAALSWGPARPVSASHLEAWSRCHFMGLARRILKLEEDDEASEEPDARMMGDLMHATLRRLVPRLQRRGHWPPAASARTIVEAELDGCLAESSDEVQRALPAGHTLLFDLAVERARRELLQVVFDEEAVAPFVGASPVAFEQAFGRRDAPEVLRQVSIPPALPGERPIFLTGAIDRVDAAPTQIAIIDYKRSRAGSPKARLEALLLDDFQLPVYAFAARQQYPGRAVDAAWVGLRHAESLPLSRVLNDASASLDDLLAVDADARRRLAEASAPNLANAVHTLQASLRSGDFGARPRDCRSCHLRSVCRISARRLLDERGSGS